MSYTDGARSPEIFRRWAAISLVAGALERRVWIQDGKDITFPNLYVLMVAPPGVGKGIIEDARQLWEETRLPGTKAGVFHVAPDSLTKAALVDTLAAAERTHIPPNGKPIYYHSLLVASEEFSILLPGYDLEFVGTLNGIFGNKPVHREARRHGPARSIEIEFPQLNILAGAQPSYLASVFPEDVWNTGIARRLLMIYANETPFIDMFADLPDNAIKRDAILNRLAKLSQMYGQLRWKPEAATEIQRWNREGLPPQPTHSRLVHYLRSRLLQVLKLIIVSTIARTGDFEIGLEDVERARGWLLDAEHYMPDIFREMVGRSDRQVLDELRIFVVKGWSLNKRKPIPGNFLREFLLQRVPHDKVETILNVADKAKVIARVAGTDDMWIPQPRTELGAE